MTPPTNLLLFACDLMAQSELLPALEAGDMPVLRKIRDTGVSGGLRGLEGCSAALGWTSVATGHHPAEHGVLGLPVDGPRRRAALWTRFSRAGWKTRVVGWPGAHPAEEVNGVFISELFTRAAGTRGALPAGCVHPTRLEEEVGSFRVKPAEIEPGLLRWFMPEITPARLEHDTLAQRLLVHLANLYGTHNATLALAGGDGGLWVVQCPFLRRVRQDFGIYATEQPETSAVSAEDRHFYGQVLARAHALRDMLLGELCRELGAGLSVCVVSSGGEWRARRSILGEGDGADQEAGFFAASGPLFAEGGKTVEGATLFDLAPTLERACGLAARHPGSRSGRILADVLSSGVNVAERETPAKNEPVSVDDDAVQTVAEPALAGEQALRLGRALWQTGRVEEAWPWLERAWFFWAGDLVLALLLGRCRAGLGLLEEAAALEDAIQDFRDGTPRVDLALAEAAADRADHTALLEHARRAELKGAPPAQTRPLLGQALLHLRRWEEAEVLARAWLADAPGLAWGRLLLTRALFHQERHAEAAQETERLLQAFPGSAVGWFTRGQLETAAGRPGPAKEAHEHAVRLNPNLVSARLGSYQADQAARKARGEDAFFQCMDIDFREPPQARRAREETERLATRRAAHEELVATWRVERERARAGEAPEKERETVAAGDLRVRPPWSDEAGRLRARFGEAFAVQGAEVRVVTRGDPERMLGAVAFVPGAEPQQRGSLRLALLPSFRGTPIHERLLDHGLALARAAGSGGAMLVLASDDPAVPFYLRQGAVVLRTDRFYEGSILTFCERARRIRDRIGVPDGTGAQSLHPTHHPAVARLAAHYELLTESRALAALAKDYDPDISGVCHEQGTLAGAILVKHLSRGRAYVETLMVDPLHAAASGSLSSRLITHACERALAKGCTIVILNCQPEKNPETVNIARRGRCRQTSETLVLAWP